MKLQNPHSGDVFIVLEETARFCYKVEQCEDCILFLVFFQAFDTEHKLWFSCAFFSFFFFLNKRQKYPKFPVVQSVSEMHWVVAWQMRTNRKP